MALGYEAWQEARRTLQMLLSANESALRDDVSLRSRSVHFFLFIEVLRYQWFLIWKKRTMKLLFTELQKQVCIIPKNCKNKNRTHIAYIPNKANFYFCTFLPHLSELDTEACNPSGVIVLPGRHTLGNLSLMFGFQELWNFTFFFSLYWPFWGHSFPIIIYFIRSTQKKPTKKN